MAARRIGMIVPPAEGRVPPEPLALYPELEFIARGLGLPALTPEGYDAVIGRAADLAADLRDEGAEVVSLMGTSLSFYRGPQGNRAVLEAMHAACGLPVTTMTDSVLEALRHMGARRIAVATAYDDRVNAPLAAYLAQSGFEALSLEGMNLTQVSQIFAVTDDDLLAAGARAIEAAPGAEALLISCGGLQTLPVVPPLEDRFGIPVVTSATAGAWGAVRLAGHPTASPGHGRLFAD